MTATKLTTTIYCNHSTHLVQLHFIQNHHPVICQHRHLLLNLAVDGLKTSLAAGRRCSSSGIVPLFRLLPAGLVPLPGCCMPLGLAVQHGQHTLHVALCTPHGYTGVMEWLSGCIAPAWVSISTHTLSPAPLEHLPATAGLLPQGCCQQHYFWEALVLVSSALPSTALLQLSCCTSLASQQTLRPMHPTVAAQECHSERQPC